MIESQLHLPYLRELIVFLIAAAIFVPLFQKIKVSPTIGFLIIGFLIGPFGLGLWVEQIGFVKYAVITEVEGVKTFAELGVIFLLFTIGLELSPNRLWAMRLAVFGLGSAQVLVTGGVITLIALAFGNSANASILIGACLALSSTAMVVQLLVENGRFSSPVGKTSFSILLFQDLAVVPIILLVGILGAKDSGGLGLSIAVAIGTAAAVVTCIFIFGQIVLRPLFSLVTFRHSPEFFMAMTLLILILSSTITAMAGLSMALGAFLAGLLLAETEFRHQIEIDIEPFKGLFMGLFFMSIGMGIDLRIVWSDLFWVASSVIGLYFIKALIITGICMIARKPLSVALPTGMLLGQGGEFAFVVIAISMQAGLIPSHIAQFMVITASLSMIATPFVVLGAIRLMDYFADDIRGDHPYKLTETGEELSQHVIIAGFGRSGQAIAKMLSAQQVSYAALDRKGPLVMKMKRQGHPVIYGDSSRKEVLRALDIDKAVAVVIALNDIHATENTLRICREEWPGLPVFIRAYEKEQEIALKELGATQVVSEISESSFQLAGHILHQIGAPLEALNNLKEEMQKKENSPQNDAISLPDGEKSEAKGQKGNKTAA